jgi:hypothetical protein
MSGVVLLKKQNKKIMIIVAYTIKGISANASSNDFSSYIVRYELENPFFTNSSIS